MEIESWVKYNKKVNAAILNFLESESNSEDEFKALIKIISTYQIAKYFKSILEMFCILFIIGDNHHRTADFFNRLGLIFEYLRKSELAISNKDIFNIYKRNRRLLLLLFAHKVIIPDEYVIKYVMNNENPKEQELKYYLFSEIKNHLKEETVNAIENEITEKFNESIETFESKIKEGENDSPICKLIREDSIQEFVSYVNRTNLPLTSTIKSDFYESHSFLINNEPSLIEYASFYGSIQVIKYLRNKHVRFPSNIWKYAVHSNNPEIIEFLEDNKIEIEMNDVKESIKCHHNEITNYIINIFLSEPQNGKYEYFLSVQAAQFCNYYYYPEDPIRMISNPEKEKFYMYKLIESINELSSPFSFWIALSNITIPSSVTSIGDSAFHLCHRLHYIRIPSSVTSIGNDSFRGCSSLNKITFDAPSSLTSIGCNAFNGCSFLEEISIPSSVTSIGEGAFAYCSSLRKITFENPSFITSIEDELFMYCAMSEISIPPFVKSIGKSAFSNCSALSQLSIPSSVTSIGESAFWCCSLLFQLSIPSSVTSIGEAAFYKCSSLTQLSIPSSLNIKDTFLDYKVKVLRI